MESRLNTFYRDQVLADSDRDTAFNPFGDGSNTNPQTLSLLRGFTDDTDVSRTKMVNALLNGPLLKLPAGDIRAAVGAERRNERRSASSTSLLNSAEPTFSRAPTHSRDITSAFGELYIPLVSEDNRLPGIERLELSAAVRYSDYSDVGSSTNPKFGLTWMPIKGLALHGSYGTSFRAPNLDLFDLSFNSNIIFALPDPASATDSTVSLVLIGNNTDSIRPEEAKTWTLGAQFAPESVPGLNVGLSYFDINYTDRIGSAIDRFASVLAEDDVFASIVTRDPPLDRVNAILNGPVFLQDQVGISDPEEILAIVDLRVTNISVSKVRGLDTAISYAFDSRLGHFDTDLSASYYLDYIDLFTATSPPQETIGTVGKPVDLSLRSGVTWSSRGLSIGGFANYLHGYTDTQNVPNHHIDSYTTVDLRFAYSPQNMTSPWDGITMSLFVRNAFDREPPFFDNLRGIAFDPEKANPQGRFVALQCTKNW